MISITKSSDIPLREVLRRSPVAEMPGAEAILDQCVLRSREIYYGLVDDEVACVWGLIPPTLLSNTAYLWLLTTDIISENKFLFIRHSQRYIEKALEVWPIIVGDVLASNGPARKWLGWLGAEFSPEINGYLKFVIRKRSNG
jgi:hypothetical protein